MSSPDERYKKYLENNESRSKGLGDTVSKITTSVGLDKLAKKVSKKLGYDDCGCDERKEVLNKLFKYKSPECLEKDEYLFLTEWFKLGLVKPDVSDVDARNTLFDIYNRVFKESKKYTNCGSCVKGVVSQLKKLIEVY